MTLQPPQPSRYSHTDSKERNYQQIRVRQDTNENWLKNDPRPASGEFCYSINGTNITRYVMSPPESATAPEPSEELLGTFIVDVNYDIWRCDLNPAWSDDPPSDDSIPKYIWVATGETYKQPEVDPETGAYYSNQCLKIGNGSGAPWSQLPWLGGRGQAGPAGPPGAGLRILGTIGYCGPPRDCEEEGGVCDPQEGDLWIVSCKECLDGNGNSCNGVGWIWYDDTGWSSVGNIQGPPGNSVQFVYVDWEAEAGEGRFTWGADDDINPDTSIVTVNGVVIRRDSQYSWDEANRTLILDENCVADDDIVSLISLTGTEASASFYAFTDDIRTRQESPINFKIARSDITTQQEANWYILDKIDSLEKLLKGTDK